MASAKLIKIPPMKRRPVSSLYDRRGWTQSCDLWPPTVSQKWLTEQLDSKYTQTISFDIWTKVVLEYVCIRAVGSLQKRPFLYKWWKNCWTVVITLQWPTYLQCYADLHTAFNSICNVRDLSAGTRWQIKGGMATNKSLITLSFKLPSWFDSHKGLFGVTSLNR